ncbi:MAG: tail fiber domain-containing protein [Methylococcales bacterium]|nr:tail fiber domain-containing protein [Methylococcales bacterium]
MGSDQRLKNHITDLPLGLDFIGKLRPVEYTRNNNSEQTKEWGLIAQELQETLHDAGYQKAGIVTEDASKEKYLTVRYNDLFAPMIKAIQEQDKKIQDQQKTIAAQQEALVALLKRIEAIEKK